MRITPRQRAWMFSSVVSAARPAKTSERHAFRATTAGSMGMIRCAIPNAWACVRASSTLMAAVYREGMRTASTSAGPRASTAMHRASAESMPPESPSTAPRNPFFGDIVSDPEDQRRVHGVLLGQHRGDLAGQEIGAHLDDEYAFGEFRGAPGDAARAVHRHGTPIEDQLVLSAHEVQVHDRQAALAERAPQHRLALRPLAGMERGSVDVDDEPRPGGARLGRRAFDPDPRRCSRPSGPPRSIRRWDEACTTSKPCKLPEIPK